MITTKMMMLLIMTSLKAYVRIYSHLLTEYSQFTLLYVHTLYNAQYTYIGCTYIVNMYMHI